MKLARHYYQFRSPFQLIGDLGRSQLKTKSAGVGSLEHLGDCVYVYFDGLCEPKNPGGVATYGLVVKRGGQTIHRDSGLAFAKPWTDEASNNVAEYSAIIRGLEWLESNKMQSLCIYFVGDSKLIINQLKGDFKVKALRLVELHEKALELMSKFEDVHLEWVDRSQNNEADLLSRVAYSRFKKESNSTDKG